MPLLSLRLLISGLALCCIIITAVICTVIAVLSGDSALEQTKDAASEGLRRCFAQGAEALSKTRAADGEAIDTCFSGATGAITLRTNELLRTTAEQVAGTILETQFTHMRLVMKWYDYLMAERPLSATDTNAFLDSIMRGVWSDYRQFRATGLTGLQIETYRTAGSVGRSRNFFEHPSTMLNPADGPHHELIGRGDGNPGTYGTGTALFGGRLNYTLDPVWDAYFKRLPGGGLEHPDCRYGKISPITGKECLLVAMPGCRAGAWVHTQGVVDDGFCLLNGEMSDGPAQQLSRTFWPVGHPRVSALSELGPYLGLAVGMVWGTATQKIGHVIAAIDVNSYNVFLQGIKVGGEKARSRILIIGEDHWLHRMLPLPTFDNRGFMIAVSKGNSSTFEHFYVDSDPNSRWRQRLRRAVQAQDPLVRATARHIESNVNGSYAALAETITSFQMNSTLAGGGWVEVVPGPNHPMYLFYPPTNETLQYINGYREPEDEGRAPLAGYAADGEEFFLSVQRLRSRLTDRKPVYQPWDETPGQSEWFMVLIIDREYILGETDRQQATTKERIEENNQRIAAEVQAGTQKVQSDIAEGNEEVQESLDLDRMILYIVVAGSGVLLMGLAMVCAAAIVAPINQLRIEMAQVATMKLEVVDEKRPVHSIAEVGNMQASFLKMVQNLREYRNYMPASVLVDSDEDVEEVADQTDKGTEPAADKDAFPRRISTNLRERTNTSGSRASTATRSTHARLSHAQQEAEAAHRAKQATAVGLTKKSSGFMVFNVICFTDLIKTGGPACLLETTAALLTRLVEEVRVHKGIPDAFNADRFYASWNTVRQCAQSRNAAARAALVLTSSLRGPLGDAKGSWACGGGEILCGNMGIDGMKKYCCVGIPANFVHLMEPHNAAYQTSLLVDAKTKQDVQDSMMVRTLKQVKYGGVDMRIFEVCGAKKMEEDEWMYQLEAAEKADPHRTFSEAVELSFKGDYGAAIAMLRGDENRTPQHDIMIYEFNAKL